MAKVPKFLQCLYDILQYEDRTILHWCHDGTYFQVRDVPRLEREVLPKYFKHGKFASFQRQLNNFGFHKWTKTRANVCTFSHDVLVQCHPHHLSAMLTAVAYTHGKTAASAASAAPKVVVTPLTGLKRQRSNGVVTERVYCSAAATMTAAMTAATTVEAKTHTKRICLDMDTTMTANMDMDIVGVDTNYTLRDADLDHILDSLVGSAGGSSPLLLLDAVDVSDLLALDWSQAVASSVCRRGSLSGPCSACGTSESDCRCDSRAVIAAATADDAMDSIDTTAGDDDLPPLLPDLFSFECAGSDNGDECHDIDITVALVCLAPNALGSELFDDDALFATLDGDTALMHNQHHDQSQQSAEYIASL